MKETSIKTEEAMKLNRAARRKIGNPNGIKIYGSSTAHIPKDKKPHALTTFTGKKI